MDLLNGWTIGLAVVLAYVVAVFALYRTKRIGPDRALSFFGPALMLKTRRGQGFLDRVGRYKRFWSVVGDLGIVLSGVAMVAVIVVLVLDAIVALRIPASAAPSPQEALGIPGLNPIIPLGYGIVALIVGVVLHELMHGVLARSQNIGVKSIGVLWLVIPIGAFVEQDDEEMAKAPRRPRGRVAAGGVLANFALTGVFFLVMSVLVSTSVAPNATGVGIGYVVPGTPAANATIAAGSILTSVNGTPTPNNGALFSALSGTHPGQQMVVTFTPPGSQTIVTRTVTLAPLSSYSHNEADRTHGFLGVSPTFLTPTQLRNNFVMPLTNPNGPLIGATFWLLLPLAGLQPVQGSTQSFYHTTGPFAGGNLGTFWVVANVLYWLAWMNLLLGLSNSLPLIPLDGGLLFRDFAAAVASRARRGWDSARLDQFAGRAAAGASAFILVLLVWQFVAPRL